MGWFDGAMVTQNRWIRMWTEEEIGWKEWGRDGEDGFKLSLTLA